MELMVFKTGTIRYILIAVMYDLFDFFYVNPFREIVFTCINISVLFMYIISCEMLVFLMRF